MICKGLAVYLYSFSTKNGPKTRPAEDLIFYISTNFRQYVTHGAIPVTECLADYYRTGELTVTEYVEETYDSVDHHIKEVGVTPPDLKILLDELQSVQNPEHGLYQSWIGDDTRQRWLAHIQSVYQTLQAHT